MTAWTCSPLTARQPDLECWLPILFFVGLVVPPICCPFGATQHLQTYTCHIGSLPCLPKSTTLSSVCLTMMKLAMRESSFLLRLPAYTPTQKVRCANPSMSHRFRCPSFKLFTADFCHLGLFTTQLLWSHHFTVCSLDGSALCKVFQTRQPCVFGRSSCSPLTAVAPLLLLAHDHVRYLAPHRLPVSWICSRRAVPTASSLAFPRCTPHSFAAFVVVCD